MSNAKGNFQLRLIKGSVENTKGIRYRIVNNKLALYLTKTKGYISPENVREWSRLGWYIESDDILRAKAMFREICDGQLLIDIKEAQKQ
jgi:hypothetical protein